jgi:glycerol-3-phosphate dehydrogenase
LKAALGDAGVYAETGDRRLAFVLPFADSILVGTTDEQWAGSPDQAVASEEELDYLRDIVDRVFGLKLTRDDIESHYSGVRPLPRTEGLSKGAISRDHSLAEHRLHGVNVMTLVGGKLTTFRSVGQQIADRVLEKLTVPRVASTTDRVLMGGEDFPVDSNQWKGLRQQWAAEFGSTEAEVAALWPLYGMRTRSLLAEVASMPAETVEDTPFSRRIVYWIIRHEWITTLDDLVERRLLLVFSERLTSAALTDLAVCMAQSGRISPEDIPSTVDATCRRLETFYGRKVIP